MIASEARARRKAQVPLLTASHVHQHIGQPIAVEVADKEVFGTRVRHASKRRAREIRPGARAKRPGAAARQVRQQVLLAVPVEIAHDGASGKLSRRQVRAITIGALQLDAGPVPDPGARRHHCVLGRVTQRPGERVGRQALRCIAVAVGDRLHKTAVAVRAVRVREVPLTNDRTAISEGVDADARANLLQAVRTLDDRVRDASGKDVVARLVDEVHRVVRHHAGGSIACIENLLREVFTGRGLLVQVRHVVAVLVLNPLHHPYPVDGRAYACGDVCLCRENGGVPHTADGQDAPIARLDGPVVGPNGGVRAEGLHALEGFDLGAVFGVRALRPGDQDQALAIEAVGIRRRQVHRVNQAVGDQRALAARDGGKPIQAPTHPADVQRVLAVVAHAQRRGHAGRSWRHGNRKRILAGAPR